MNATEKKRRNKEINRALFEQNRRRSTEFEFVNITMRNVMHTPLDMNQGSQFHDLSATINQPNQAISAIRAAEIGTGSNTGAISKNNAASQLGFSPLLNTPIVAGAQSYPESGV